MALDKSQKEGAQVSGDDIVQCVPSKKGHQILFKGYTYVFKARLQCGAEQWCCSYKQKTEEPVEAFPDWIGIYFVKVAENEQRCNICEVSLAVDEKSPELLDHITGFHKEIFDLHKNNPEATVGFRIEFLHLNVEKDDPKEQNTMILEEICEEEIVDPSANKLMQPETETEQQIIVMPRVPKAKKERRIISDKSDNRRRSWVWKYFNRISNIIFRCTLCNVVLSIKGCNTNNMNRHIRSRHPSVFMSETVKKRREPGKTVDSLELTEMETPMAIKTEEIVSCDKDTSIDDSFEITMSESPSSRARRSWIWMYFTRISATSAQCKLCNRNICHGGNATGNMNRHLKMIHQKTGDNPTWVWKVFETADEHFYSCKICQFRCMKFPDMEKSISIILDHLRTEHGVISGDQIITGTDDVEDHLINE